MAKNKKQRGQNKNRLTSIKATMTVQTVKNKIDKIEKWLTIQKNNPKMENQKIAAKKQLNILIHKFFFSDYHLSSNDSINKKPRQFKKAYTRWKSHKEKKQVRVPLGARRQTNGDSLGNMYQLGRT